MAHAVVGSDIDLRRAGRRARQQRIDLRRRRISEHDRTGLRLHGFDLADAIVLLGDGGQLVLADAVFRISRDRRHRRKAGLHMAAPCQPIHVIAGLVVAHEHAGVDHAPQIFAGLGIDRRIVGIDRRRQVDLGLGDMQKAPGLAAGALARLGARQDVVGRGQNFGGASRRRPQCAKGLYQGHCGCSSFCPCRILIRGKAQYVKARERTRNHPDCRSDGERQIGAGAGAGRKAARCHH